MATTWIKPLHVNKGKTIDQTITDRTDYAENPDKRPGRENWSPAINAHHRRLTRNFCSPNSNTPTSPAGIRTGTTYSLIISVRRLNPAKLRRSLLIS